MGKSGGGSRVRVRWRFAEVAPASRLRLGFRFARVVFAPHSGALSPQLTSPAVAARAAMRRDCRPAASSCIVAGGREEGLKVGWGRRWRHRPKRSARAPPSPPRCVRPAAPPPEAGATTLTLESMRAAARALRVLGAGQGKPTTRNVDAGRSVGAPLPRVQAPRSAWAPPPSSSDHPHPLPACRGGGRAHSRAGTHRRHSDEAPSLPPRVPSTCAPGGHAAASPAPARGRVDHFLSAGRSGEAAPRAGGARRGGCREENGAGRPSRALT